MRLERGQAWCNSFWKGEFEARQFAVGASSQHEFGERTAIDIIHGQRSDWRFGAIDDQHGKRGDTKGFVHETNDGVWPGSRSRDDFEGRWGGIHPGSCQDTCKQRCQGNLKPELRSMNHRKTNNSAIWG
jgi:hypothetical protein